MRGYALLAVAGVFGVTALMGCSSPQRTVAAAPPVNSGPMAMPQGSMPQGSMQQMGGSAPAGGVYDWRDVPAGERVPVMRTVFDQAGYQIYAASGETIVVPFTDQNLYVMRFGRSGDGSYYFLNDNGVPTLFLPLEGYLENAVAQGARWYPLPRDYAYSRPVYVGIAPTWNDYVGMGWYPGMMTYGGMWGYHPGASFVWMPSFYVSIGGRRYNDYVSYRSYYTSHRGYVPNRVVYRNYTPTRRTVSNFGSSGSFSGRSRSGGFSGSTGSFGSGRTSGGFSGSPGSFGSGRRSSGFGSSTGSFSGRSSGFGSSTGSVGSSGRSSGFGSAAGGSSSFGSGSATGSGRPSSSFGGSSGFGSSGRSTGSSFGGTRSFGSSFGRSSGSSFGSGSSSSSGSSGRSSGSFGGGSSSSFRSSGSSFGGGSSSGRSSSFGRSSGSFGRRR